MKKFEYKIVGPSAVEEYQKLLKMSDPKIKNVGFLEIFNYLGEEGWEFCAVYSMGNFLMKREKK